MRKLRAVVFGCGLALLASLIVVQPASASQAWTPPETLGLHADAVKMDVNAAGDAVAVWSSRQEVQASFRPAGRDWQLPVVLDRSAGSVLGAFVDVRGRATAVWSDGETHVAVRGLDGHWRQDLKALDTSEVGDGEDPTVAAGPAGNMVFTWSTFDDTIGLDQYITWRLQDGRWSDIIRGGGDMVATVVGGVATLFPRYPFAPSSPLAGLDAQTVQAGEAPTPLHRIWTAANYSEPAVASNARGDMVLATITSDNFKVVNGAPGQLLVLTKSAGGDWREAFTSDSGDSVLTPSVAINDSGEVAVTFRRASDSALEVLNGDVQDGITAGPTIVSQDSQPAAASIALAPDGDAVATWASPGSDTQTVYAAHRPAGGEWSDAVPVGEQTAGNPSVHAYPNGMFTALFLDDGTAQASDFVDDSVGPETRVTAPRRSFTTSTRVQVRWDTTDALSRPDTSDVRVRTERRTGSFSAWSTWKAKSAQWSGVFTGKPGATYCFSARSRDRLGNLGPWSGQRCITTPTDDRAFRASATWSRVSRRGTYQHTVTVSRTAGARLVLRHVRATSLRLLAVTSPKGGSVRVTYAGQRLGIFDLTSRGTRRRAITLASHAGPRTGSVVIRVVGDGKPVRIDGLVAAP